MEKVRVLIISPSLDGGDIGEVEWAFQWVNAMSRHAAVTVLATQRQGRTALQNQLPDAKVITWPELAIFSRRFERFNAMAKPYLPLFSLQVRRWLRSAKERGEHFDIGHQILPQAMRYATPLRGMGLPYVIGPLGGALQTPQNFQDEVRGGSSFASRLRAIDAFRLKHDPLLRAGYADAALVLGVAPYVKELLGSVKIQQFQAILERGHGIFPPCSTRQTEVGKLRLLHVGRAVRTKGLRDTVRAMALLRDLPGVTLTSAGDGEDLAACRVEAQALGVADRITFLGKIPRDAVEAEYAAADVFCFPSFREPMGGVFFEAMAHGLPVITAARGGPDFIIDDTSGIRLPVETPEQFAHDIAGAIRSLAMNPAQRLALGHGARARLMSFGTWDEKAVSIVQMYRDILAARTLRQP